MSDRDEQTEQTEQAPEPGQVQPGGEGAGTEGGEEFKSEESKRAVLADLKSERTRRQQYEQELESYRQAEEQRRQEAMSEQERALEQARTEAAEQARTETRQAVNDRLFRAEVRATAAGRVADTDLLDDPAIAKRLLGLDEVPLTESGDIDAEVISAKLDELVERKPYLAPGETQRAPQIDTGQGRRQAEAPDLGSMSTAEYLEHFRNRRKPGSQKG